jgi:hypothetical protein
MMRMVVAAVLIAGAGLLHGTWTNRWRPSGAVTALAGRIQSVPKEIGDWKVTASFELRPAEIAMVGAAGYVSWQYTNASRGVSVSVLLLGGLPGKISTHPPDVCYRGGGYTLDSPSPYVYRYGPDGRQAEFATMTAAREGTNPSTQRIFWAWNASKGWLAPQAPRWQFAAEPALCKLYVIREISGVIVDPASDPCNDFLNVFLPELDRILFSVPRAELAASARQG